MREEARAAQKMANAAEVIAAAVAASCEILGMAAENTERFQEDLAAAYGPEQFEEVIRRHGIGHNAVIERLQAGL